MSVRQLGGLLGALGGLVWIARWLQGSATDPTDLMRYVGLGLVMLGLACIGLTLVKGQARWLDFVASICIPLLFWAIYDVLRGTGAALLLHGALGAAWVVLGGWLLLKGGHRDDWDDDEYEEYDQQYG